MSRRRQISGQPQTGMGLPKMQCSRGARSCGSRNMRTCTTCPSQVSHRTVASSCLLLYILVVKHLLAGRRSSEGLVSHADLICRKHSCLHLLFGPKL